MVEVSLVDPRRTRSASSWSRPPTTAPPSTPARCRRRRGHRQGARTRRDQEGQWTETSADMSGFQMPADLDITFTPNDMARLMQAKVVEKHYAGLAAKATAERTRRSGTSARPSGAASPARATRFPDGSYPIDSAGDLHNAAHLARTGHGDAEAARDAHRRRARGTGRGQPAATTSDSKSKGTVTEAKNSTRKRRSARPSLPWTPSPQRAARKKR